jgi:CRP/FNR family cyclic AMP-dependent transcriptional regulator
VLVTDRRQLVGPLVPSRILDKPVLGPKPPTSAMTGDHSGLTTGWTTSWFDVPLLEAPETAIPHPVVNPPLGNPIVQPAVQTREIDPFYLFACHMEWERDEDPSAAWELLAAARSSHPDTRAHARALLSSSRHMSGLGQVSALGYSPKEKRTSAAEISMNAPYDLEIIDNCTGCNHSKPGFFCTFSQPALQALNHGSHKSVLPAGAILFVEGQTPRGLFIICSGKVNLSTTSREGKILILKTAEAGEVLGMSAAVSGAGYETTAETATPCQLNFVDRATILDLLQTHNEVGVQTTLCLSRDFQSAQRDIHDLVMSRSSAGKLARLLLSHSPDEDMDEHEIRIHASMTHEEMAQRIGSSRETVTRLLSNLRRKHLIRSDGPTIVIRDRAALEELAV